MCVFKVSLVTKFTLFTLNFWKSFITSFYINTGVSSLYKEFVLYFSYSVFRSIIVWPEVILVLKTFCFRGCCVCVCTCAYVLGEGRGPIVCVWPSSINTTCFGSLLTMILIFRTNVQLYFFCWVLFFFPLLFPYLLDTTLFTGTRCLCTFLRVRVIFSFLFLNLLLFYSKIGV